MKFEGQVAVVTGASSGVGRAIVLALADQGARLVVLGRRSGALDQVAEQCSGAASVHRYQVDLEDLTQITACARQVLTDVGQVNILVHSAGVIVPASWTEATMEQFDHQYRCNVRAPYALTQCFLESLRAHHGQVVFINSTAGLSTGAGISQYGATKHALRALADSLREEVNHDGVRVVSVYLGRTATPMQQKIHEHEGKKYFPERLIQPEQAARMVVDILATGREAEITDVRVRPTLKPVILSGDAGPGVPPPPSRDT